MPYDEKEDGEGKETDDDIIVRKFRGLAHRQGARSAQALFREFDRNGDGKISGLELWRASEDMGLDLTESEVSSLMHRFDVDGDGKISLLEFETFMENDSAATMSARDLEALLEKLQQQLLKAEEEHRGNLHRVFERFDENMSGDVDLMEFHAALRELRMTLTVYEAERIMDQFPSKVHGKIKYSDFIRFVRGDLPDWVRHNKEEKHVSRRASLQKLDTRLVELLRSELQHCRSDFSAVFEEFDRNGDGHITRRELHQGLRDIGFRTLTTSDVMDLMDLFDPHGRGDISHHRFCEFLQEVAGGRQEPSFGDYYGSPRHSRPKNLHDDVSLRIIDKFRSELERHAIVSEVDHEDRYNRHHQSRHTRVDLRQVFDEMDTDRSGDLDRREIRVALDKLKIHLTSHELDWVFDEFGNARSDTLRYKDLVAFIDEGASSRSPHRR